MKIKVKLLDQYILQQLIILFIGSVGLLTCLGVAVGNISDLTYKINEYNVPLLVAVQIFCLKIPEYTAYALPIALLLTALLVYGSLNNNLELIGFYSSGISIYTIVTPAIILSLFVTVATFLLNEFIVPNANYKVARLEKNLPKSNFYWQKKDIFYPEYQVFANDTYKLLRLYYAKEFDGNSFKKIIIINFGRSSNIQKIIVAQKATWDQNQKVWQLLDGRIENIEPVKDTLPCNDRTLRNLACFNFVKVDFFRHRTLFLPPIFFEIANQGRDPQEMSLRQAIKYLKLIVNSNDEQKIRLFEVRIQQKLAFPFICLVFATIGSGIGVNFHQINRGRGFSICVGIVFSYYLLGFIVGSLGIVGLVSPLVAGWLPNFLGLGMGSWLIYCSNR